MTQHVQSGGDIEVMGMLLGTCVMNAFQINDCFILPVEGTETRVNAQDEAYEFLINYKELEAKTGSKDSVVGWYHSHPGYGCWLSGIDVATQRLHQQHFDPFVAIVIDPKKTLENGTNVEIGAFRTFNQTQQSDSSSKESWSNGPSKRTGMSAEKLHDFGAHSSEYYALTVEYFYNETDEQFLLQNYAEFGLAESILLNTDTIQSENAPVMHDLSNVLDELAAANGMGIKDKVYFDQNIAKIVEKSNKIATALEIGTIAQTTIQEAVEFIENHDHQEPTSQNKMEI